MKKNIIENIPNFQLRKFKEKYEDNNDLTILSCFSEIHVNCGRTLLTKILKGSKNKYIIEEKLNKNSQYGSLSHLTFIQIRKKIDFLIKKGYFIIKASDSQFKLPLVKLTEKGYSKIKDEIPIDLDDKENIHDEDIETTGDIGEKVEKIVENKSVEEDISPNVAGEDDGKDKSTEKKRGEIFVSKEKWHNLFKSYRKRDKKRRKDYEKDGGTF